jgi:predicted MFS family arabinose efflux permease
MSVAVLNILPALAGVLTLDLGWTEQAIGGFAACDSAGAMVGTLLAAALMRTGSLRALTLIGLAVLALADCVSGFSRSAALLLAARLVGSMGGGLAMGICFAIFASGRPERGIALWAVGQLLFGLIAITALPHLTAAIGWQSAFYGLAILVVPALVLARHLPDGAAARSDLRAAPRDVIGRQTWIAIAGVGLFYFGQAEFWPYLEVVGFASGIDHHSVETSLSVSSASAVTGSVLILLSGKRFGYTVPLLIGFAAAIAAILTIHSADALIFRAAISLFTFAWPVFSAYQFALISQHDPSGRVAALVTTANWAGLSLGPLAAGALLKAGAGGSVQWLSIVLDTAALLSLAPLMRRRQ